MLHEITSPSPAIFRYLPRNCSISITSFWALSAKSCKFISIPFIHPSPSICHKPEIIKSCSVFIVTRWSTVTFTSPQTRKTHHLPFSMQPEKPATQPLGVKEQKHKYCYQYCWEGKQTPNVAFQQPASPSNICFKWSKYRIFSTYKTHFFPKKNTLKNTSTSFKMNVIL